MRRLEAMAMHELLLQGPDHPDRGSDETSTDQSLAIRNLGVAFADDAIEIARASMQLPADEREEVKAKLLGGEKTATAN